ncbi:MAG: response regulator transcription factor [Bacteroidales bacterium]|nr:response regulator transcription factor [Bacteroidales bacterium]
MKYNTLIVDDEFLARKLLSGYVDKIDDLNLVGTAANAFEAFKLVKENHVDILLLDIHMPDLNGLDFAKACVKVPAIIFITAYSEHALESFEADAVDYLLKPVAFPRFQKAIDKAKAKIDGIFKAKNIVATDEKTESNAEKDSENKNEEDEEILRPHNYLLVKADYRQYKIKYADLLYIEGQHEYVSFYLRDGKRITALYSLKNLEQELPADLFIRIHKSYIVSIDNISESSMSNVVVADRKLPIGGSYRDNFISKLNHTT